MKTHTHRSKSQVKTSRGYIDAFVVQPHDFSSYVNIRNLLIFLLDRLSKLVDNESISQYLPEMIKSIEHMRSLTETSATLFDHDLERVLLDIIDESEILIKLMESFLSTESNFEIQTLITARTTQIHWLCVCALEDLKKNLPSSH